MIYQRAEPAMSNDNCRDKVTEIRYHLSNSDFGTFNQEYAVFLTKGNVSKDNLL